MCSEKITVDDLEERVCNLCHTKHLKHHEDQSKCIFYLNSKIFLCSWLIKHPYFLTLDMDKFKALYQLIYTEKTHKWLIYQILNDEVTTFNTQIVISLHAVLPMVVGPMSIKAIVNYHNALFTKNKMKEKLRDYKLRLFSIDSFIRSNIL